MSFTFNIDYKEYTRALEDYPKEVGPVARVAIKERLTAVQRRAALIHRYMTRSGALQKAFELIMEGSFAGELVLSKTISNAQYAYAIHEGRKDWTKYVPDRFLYKAWNYYESKEPFREVCKKIVHQALQNARLI
jgi:hypothetical protein